MATSNGQHRIVIMGAAGRDFHDFNSVYRDDPGSEVVAFTAARIPGIADPRYPLSLAGPRYPDGIPILDERDLADIGVRLSVDEVVFAYGDVRHVDVMHKASIAFARGADFTLLGPHRTMLVAAVPVIAVSAVRTGVGKSQVARWLSRRLSLHGGGHEGQDVLLQRTDLSQKYIGVCSSTMRAERVRSVLIPRLTAGLHPKRLNSRPMSAEWVSSGRLGKALIMADSCSQPGNGERLAQRRSRPQGCPPDSSPPRTRSVGCGLLRGSKNGSLSRKAISSHQRSI